NILGIKDLASKFPNQLSGGQKQRVAIARAMINEPSIIMGDEPTGNLDKNNSRIVFETFKQLATEFGQTLLIVTHDPDFSENTQRIIEMEDGRIIRQ
ncbi:MAG TPA: ATP-binding cassette domain-containing protein, partial [Saprospiraceae bacterium]|nr:ATP-binding cassette domain-containing protein [Saprospiraceae bacterium]